MRRFVLPLVALVAAAAPAGADTAEEANARAPRKLALAQTLETAVRQNPTLARASIDVAIAKASALEAMGLDDWVVTGTGSWTSSKREPTPGNPFQTTGNDTFALTAGISRALRTGGSISIDMDGSRSDTDYVADFGGMSSFNDSTRSYAAGVNVTFFQPLLRDRGERIARAAQRQAAIARDSATLAREAAALDTVRSIITAYWELSYAAREVEIRKGSLELAEEQLRITRAGIDAGATAPTASLALEQGIAVREEAILLAEIAVSERSLELRRLVGLEVGPGEIDVETSEPPAIEERAYDLDATLARALERNPNLALLAKNDESRQIEIELTENGLRPRLDFTASAGPDASSDTVGNTLEQIAKLQSYRVSASVSFQHTLGNRAAKGANERAQQSARRNRLDLAEGKRETAVAVVRATNLVRTARKRIEVTNKSIELSEKNLSTEKARFEAGDATNFDILRRQEEIEQARLSHERAVVDYLQALALVDALTGDLLDRYGIRIDEGSDS